MVSTFAREAFTRFVTDQCQVSNGSISIETDIPSEEQVLKIGKELVLESSTDAWKKGKLYPDGNVLVTSRPKGPKELSPWFARHSTHTKEDGTFDEFWIGLGVDKGVRESEYLFH